MEISPRKWDALARWNRSLRVSLKGAKADTQVRLKGLAAQDRQDLKSRSFLTKAYCDHTVAYIIKIAKGPNNN